jgi:DNA modification methylase
MQLKTVKISSLKPHKSNPNQHPQEQINELQNSLDQFDQIKNIVVWQNQVIAGCGLLEAALRQGREKIEVQDVSDWSEEKAIKFMISDNRLAELAIMDDDMLADLLKDFDEPLDIPGIDESFLDELDIGNEGGDGNTNPDSVSEVAKPVVKNGELWLLGKHRLLCGDCIKQENVEQLMDGEKADMVFTDPPYGMKLEADFSSMKSSMKSIVYGKKVTGNKYKNIIGDHDDFKPELILCLFKFYECKEIFLFGADYYAEILPNKNSGSWLVWDKRKENQSQAIGAEFELIWSKQKHKRRMLRHDWFGFLSSQNAKEAQYRIHPAQKPTSLLIDIISQWGDKLLNIIDPFLGSGSTLIACEKTNRICYGMEIDEHYCTIILQRWADYTSKDPVREDGVKFSELKNTLI